MKTKPIIFPHPMADFLGGASFLKGGGVLRIGEGILREMGLLSSKTISQERPAVTTTIDIFFYFFGTS